MIKVDEAAGGVRVLRLANGPVNVIDLELLLELNSTLATLRDVPAVVITGEGRAFSAGVDLRRIVDGGRPYASDFLAALTAVFRTVFDHPRPVVAAVNGHAIAGGCVIAAACDRRLMSAGTIGVTEVLVGVPFPTSGLEAVRYVVGPATASLVLTGATYGPAEAKAVGLVDEVAAPESLLDEAVAAAGRLAAIPASTFAVTKAMLRGAVSRQIAEADAAEHDRLVDLWTGDEVQGAITAYLDQLAARRR